MKKMFLAAFSAAWVLVGFSLTHSVMAGDIINGWSDVTTILEMRSTSTVVDLRLNSSIAGCGTPADGSSYWRVAIDTSETNRHKRAMLLAAYLSGKRVQLRCENSMVSDFAVAD